MKTPDSPAPRDPRARQAVRVSAALVSRRGPALAAIFREALDAALNPGELAELILQSLLFDGYPCALEGFLTLKELLHDRLPADAAFEAYDAAHVAQWRGRGEALCRRIYGRNFEPLMDNVAALSPTLKEWMLVEGYGRVLARPSLDIALRELGIVAILTVKELPRQLHSHLRGALRVGVPPEGLDAALEWCAEFATPEALARARDVRSQVRPVAE
ncbi:MAG: carboxymuconolactone decarboxylase family protein [Candidatus Zixiibacteriota bacterium]|nr:MAG: carboxymuconolactone decarboxylase family protein [candidate division Zixibacteria bacterium]